MYQNLNLNFRIGVHFPSPGLKTGALSSYRDMQVNATAREVGGNILAFFYEQMAENSAYAKIAFTISDLPNVLLLENVRKCTVNGDPRLFDADGSDVTAEQGVDEVQNALLRFIRQSELALLERYENLTETTDLINEGLNDRITKLVQKCFKTASLSLTKESIAEELKGSIEALAAGKLSKEDIIRDIRAMLADTASNIILEPGDIHDDRCADDYRKIGANFQAALDLIKELK